MGIRSLLEQAPIIGCLFKTAQKSDVLSVAISGAFTIPAIAGLPFIVKIDPTGAQNVTCPTKGGNFWFLMIHGSTNNADLTIKDSAAVTIGTLSQNELGIVMDDGTSTWFGTIKQT